MSKIDASEPQFGGNNYYWDRDGYCFFIDRRPGFNVVWRVPGMDKIK